MGGKYRWLVAGFIVYALGLLAFVYFDYAHTLRAARASLDQRLLAGASAVLDVTGRGYHDGILNRQPSDEEYMDVVAKLSHLADTSGLSYAYSMIRKDGKVLFTSCSATQEELQDSSFSRFMDAYDEASEQLQTSFTSRKPLYEEYTDRWGTFRSVFIPMQAADGTRYVLGADISIETVHKASRDSLLKAASTGLLFLLLLVPMALALSRLAKKDRGLLQDEIERRTRKIAELNQSLEERVRLAESETERARKATEEARLAREQAERARREGMLEAAGRIEGVVERLSSASQEISAQVEQSGKGTEVQRERAGETATAMEEMNTTVLEMAKSANQAAEGSSQAKRKAGEGAEVVRQAVQAIGSVREQAAGLKESMAALGRQMQDIGQVMGIINDVADQTNLLALNAAIEAARAGDAGRGFAVVADEVRKLAEKTVQATKQVEQAVDTIQKGAQSNVQSVDAAAKAVDRAAELAHRSGKALEEIVAMVEAASAQVLDIASAAQEQSAASEDITHAVEEISRVSSETADAMSQSTNAVVELVDQIRELKELVAKLRESGTASA